MMWLNDLLNQQPERYRTIMTQASALTTQLKGMSSVALWFDDTEQLVAALLAAWHVGARVQLLPNQQTHALQWAAQADILVSDTPLPHANNLVVAQEKVNVPLITFRLPEQASVYLQTSGSTGEPKIMHKTAAQMCAEAAAIAQTLPETWRNLAVCASISAQHLYGLTFRVFTALRMGWEISGCNHHFPEDFIQQSQQPCIWLSSPTILTHFSEQHDWTRLRETVRGIVSAGGALPQHTAQLFVQQLNLAILDVYGSTETGVIARKMNSHTHELFPHVHARLDEQQRLCVQSPWTDGEYITADSATLSANTLTLHGRNDRIIKLADKRISLNQIEHALLQNAWVADVHCTVWKNRVGAWVSLNAAGVAYLRECGRVALLAKWREFLSVSIEKVALPRYWRLTAQALPRNAQAKIQAADVAQVWSQTICQPNWQLQTQQNNEWTFSGCVPVDLRYFSGHFADFPLVAGVVQIQWAMDLAKQIGIMRAPVMQLENLKYQQFIRPNDVVHLTLRDDKDKGKIHFTLRIDNKVCSSGRAVLSDTVLKIEQPEK